MKKRHRRKPHLLSKLPVATILLVAFQVHTVLAQVPPAKPKVCGGCIRAHEEFLASDAMQGRAAARTMNW